MYSERRTKIELPCDVRYTHLYRKPIQVIPHCCFHTQISCQNVRLHRMKRQVQN